MEGGSDRTQGQEEDANEVDGKAGAGAALPQAAVGSGGYTEAAGRVLIRNSYSPDTAVDPSTGSGTLYAVGGYKEERSHCSPGSPLPGPQKMFEHKALAEKESDDPRLCARISGSQCLQRSGW